MPRVPVHTVEDAPEASRDNLKKLEEKFGQVLNIHGEMAHAPAVLDLYASASAAIAEHTSLDPATRDAIHLAAATVNACEYCQSAYTVGAKNRGLSEEQTVAIREGRVDWDDRLAALLAVVREVADHEGFVDDATWERALHAGWSEVELLDAFADTVRTILTNYFNHFVGTELDLPPAPGLG
ncbi:MAG TPA: carboxymuconolactone decarboxylase family protein [Nitriliruptorales bacterium]|nr:carboxymuconolactone decarboxylase family protein [Nitriliruptorales bacterium]